MLLLVRTFFIINFYIMPSISDAGSSCFTISSPLCIAHGNHSCHIEGITLGTRMHIFLSLYHINEHNLMSVSVMQAGVSCTSFSNYTA